MMTKLLYAAIAISTASIASAYDPPKLLSASPSFWAIGVDASRQKSISLSFDGPMRPGFSAWFGPSSLPPESSVTTLSSDRLTFSLGVTLQPAKVYVLALNEKHIPAVGFQTEKGISLPPTYLVFQTAGTPAPNDAPPHVVRSNPVNGTQGIDPSRLASITVTFDKPMTPKKHGLHLYENNQPVDISKLPFSYSADGLTFILPYRFKPATVYRLELNSTKDIGFARTTRIPLWPAVISFSTR